MTEKFDKYLRRMISAFLTSIIMLLYVPFSAATADDLPKTSISSCGWMKIATTSDGATDYIDRCYAKNQGAYKLTVVLSDKVSEQKTETGKLYRSTRLFYALDCKAQTYAPTGLSAHTKAMGEGPVVLNAQFPEKDWKFRPVPATSSMNKILVYVCK